MVDEKICWSEKKKFQINCLLEENEIPESKMKFFLQFVLSLIDTAATMCQEEHQESGIPF